MAFEETVQLIQERLRILYRAAITNAVTLPDGSKRPKFVNLDMEEYRDLHLTAEAFKRTLMEDEFMQMEAGIVAPGLFAGLLGGANEAVRPGRRSGWRRAARASRYAW